MIKSLIDYNCDNNFDEIAKFFPAEIGTFIDLFTRNGNMGLNVRAEKVIYNDINTDLIKLFQTLKDYSCDDLIKHVESVIKFYKLSNTSKRKYAKYDLDNPKGLCLYNKDAYAILKNDIKKYKTRDFDYYIKLIVLLIYNNGHKLNTSISVGRTDFDKNIKSDLINFIDRIQSQNCDFTNYHYTNYRYRSYETNDLVFCNPPQQWLYKDKKEFYKFITDLNKNDIKFAVLTTLPCDLIKKRPFCKVTYKIYKIDKKVLITNY